jgi:23S rRNA (cytidine1920-2'-O)/16S rRNA (cytidine1409-2'-O)-methyltransferase
MRADQLLVLRSIAASRSQAARLIDAGARWQHAGLPDAPWKALSKSDNLPDDAVIEIADAAEARYVSRGGIKLEAALRLTGLDVHGLDCLDVGQSTGGFSDCLLQHGAARVTGVDVGHGQLHERIRFDPRVLCYEGVNARHLDAALFVADADDAAQGPLASAAAPASPGFDLIVGDLSFISQTLVLPALVPLLRPRARLLMLVKPQFELQPEQIGKGGLVKDIALYTVVEQRLRDCCASLGLQLLQWMDSPITGGDGNHEFFMCACLRAPTQTA